jgi:hypothetical protein
MDGNIITTISTGVAILVGVYAIVGRTEDRLNRSMDTRFNDLKDLWRAELRRVEEVLDARLKHLEEKED